LETFAIDKTAQGYDAVYRMALASVEARTAMPAPRDVTSP
jgi:hypothetical protein